MSGGLSRAEREALWSDYRVLGRLFGLRTTQMPATLSDLEDYGRAMLERRRALRRRLGPAPSP